MIYDTIYDTIYDMIKNEQAFLYIELVNLQQTSNQTNYKIITSIILYYNY